MHPLHPVVSRNGDSLQRGFTLIEVLIVIAIVGILAAIAYPGYGNYITKTRRADAHVALLQEIQTLERCKAANYSYTSCNLSSTTSPEDYYTISLTKAATTYTVTATAKGTQASDSDCSPMTINEKDVRTPAASFNCWPG